MAKDIRLQWSGDGHFKSLLAPKTPNGQYLLENGYYTLWFVDGGTEYSCAIKFETPTQAGSDQEDFEQNFKASFNKRCENRVMPDNVFQVQADAVSQVCAKGGVTNVDYRVTNRAGETDVYKYLNGAEIKVFGAARGDWAECSVVDLDNVLGYGPGVTLKTYVFKKFLFPDHVHILPAPAPGAIPVGTYLCSKYHSVGTETDPEIFINFDIQKKG